MKFDEEGRREMIMSLGVEGGGVEGGGDGGESRVVEGVGGGAEGGKGGSGDGGGGRGGKGASCSHSPERDPKPEAKPITGCSPTSYIPQTPSPSPLIASLTKPPSPQKGPQLFFAIQ